VDAIAFTCASFSVACNAETVAAFIQRARRLPVLTGTAM
jgi:hypothetical protein